MTVKRFDIEYPNDSYYEEKEDGDYVYASDYDKLERWYKRTAIWYKKKIAECEDLKAALKQSQKHPINTKYVDKHIIKERK